jgi:hypothetical protein
LPIVFSQFATVINMHLFRLLIWCIERNRNFKLRINGVKYTLWIKKQAVSGTRLEGIIHESFVDPLHSSIAFAAYESWLHDPLCGGTE